MTLPICRIPFTDNLRLTVIIITEFHL